MDAWVTNVLVVMVAVLEKHAHALVAHTLATVRKMVAKILHGK